MPTDYEIVIMVIPHMKSNAVFSGGTLLSPEIIITEPWL
jgi:hypothetical protein